jgi:2-oxoglutarate dehydrogenase E1 component
VQEEPRNMGAAGFVKMNMPDEIKLSILSRSASAATATGYAKQHALEQSALIEAAFKL